MFWFVFTFHNPSVKYCPNVLIQLNYSSRHAQQLTIRINKTSKNTVLDRSSKSNLLEGGNYKSAKINYRKTCCDLSITLYPILLPLEFSKKLELQNQFSTHLNSFWKFVTWDVSVTLFANLKHLTFAVVFFYIFTDHNWFLMGRTGTGMTWNTIFWTLLM